MCKFENPFIMKCPYCSIKMEIKTDVDDNVYYECEQCQFNVYESELWP